MPIIKADDAFSDSIIKLIMDNYLGREGRTGAWHVSDLMFPRYAVLSRIYGREPTREDVGFFFTGEAYHEFLQKLLGKKDAEVRGTLHGVTGTADYFDGTNLLEIKTSRKWTIPEFPQEHYVEQAGYYCAIFNKSLARIVVIFPTAGRTWGGANASTVEVRTWSVEFSDEELIGLRRMMETKVVFLEDAFKNKEVRNLSPCPSWKYGSVERDSEKKEYFIKVRCPFAQEGLCKCGEELEVECKRKNDNRRIKPDGEKTTRYSKK